jgi:hypothetical protein
MARYDPVVGVVVAPDDVAADHAGLLAVAGVVGAVEGGATRPSLAVVRCGLKLSQIIAILVAGA